MPNAIAKALFSQLLQGVRHCHAHGVAHRDLKPGNLLLCGRTGRLKLADFGQAAMLEAANDDEQQDAPDGALATRWYRPPEVLYGARRYAARAADMWAAGCVLAELYGLQPLLPGRGDLGQLACTVHALGTVDLTAWPEASSLPDWGKVAFTPCKGKSLQELVPALPPRAAELAAQLLALRPEDRPTAEAALLDPFFAEGEEAASEAVVGLFVRETLAAHELRMGRLKRLPVMKAPVMTMLGFAADGARGGGAAAPVALSLPPDEDEEDEGGAID
jgi:cell cycle related kinase